MTLRNFDIEAKHKMMCITVLEKFPPFKISGKDKDYVLGQVWVYDTNGDECTMKKMWTGTSSPVYNEANAWLDTFDLGGHYIVVDPQLRDVHTK